MSKYSEEFKKWLNAKLNALQTDPDVFGNYIVGILTAEETREEKLEGLEDLLSEINDTEVDSLPKSILEKWDEFNSSLSTQKPAKPASIDVEVQLAKLLEAQTLQAIVPERKYTEEERRLKEQILAQYAQTEVAYEDDYDDNVNETTEHTSTGIERNTNVEDVIQLQKEKREQARMDSAAKKIKDKEDREKQRQLREEKKEKRKTVKGERRRL